MYDKDDSFFRKLVRDHVSGQLKVAPEHCARGTLNLMGKPSVEVYEAFRRKYFDLCREAGLEQYLVPYLMSSHPGTTMADAVEMALWLKKWGYSPEQVQDFYPTPGTISTVMYYTGIHPITKKHVNVTTDYREKQLQRALLQYSRPENANLVREALVMAGREDLIGTTADCLVRPAFGKGGGTGEFVKRTKDGKGGDASRHAKNQRSRDTHRQDGTRSRNGKPTAGGAKKKSSTTSKSFAAPTAQGAKKSKLERVFGTDAARITREASAMARGGKRPAKKGKK